VITGLYLVFVAALDIGLGFEGTQSQPRAGAEVAERAFGPFGQT